MKITPNEQVEILAGTFKGKIGRYLGERGGCAIVHILHKLTTQTTASVTLYLNPKNIREVNHASNLVKLMRVKDTMKMSFMLSSKKNIEDRCHNPLDMIAVINALEAWYDNDLDHDQILRDIEKLFNDTFTNQELAALEETFSNPAIQSYTQRMLADLGQKLFDIGVAAAEEKQHLLVNRLNKLGIMGL